MSEFRMPSLGADMDAGTLVAWHVKPGDPVKRGAVVADVETDKGIVEVEIWEEGTVQSLSVTPGTKVPVGTVLAIVEARAPVRSVPPAKLEPRAVSAAREAPARSAVVAAPLPSVDAVSTRVTASPAARQLARERGIDLATVHGTGPHSVITRADVERAGAPSTDGHAPQKSTRIASTPAVEPTDASGMRRAIAAAMARSKREIPHYYLSTDLDVRTASRWLETTNATRSVIDRVLFAVLLLKATALAVREIPEMNGFFVDGGFQPAKGVHLGVAISLRKGGLIAPAIHDVDAKSTAELQTSLRDLVARARSGRLRSSEMSDATLTVTNLGEQGASSVFGVIYPPQVALVGFGQVLERAWAEGGMVGARPVVTATLSGDHRVSDGHRGALFLSAIGRLLQQPEKL